MNNFCVRSTKMFRAAYCKSMMVLPSQMAPLAIISMAVSKGSSSTSMSSPSETTVNVGAAAIDALSHIRADYYFMGITGLSIEEGLSTGDLEEAHIKLALSERAAETMVLASEEELGVASPYVVMPLKSATGVILNGMNTQSLVGAINKLGLDVHVA